MNREILTLQFGNYANFVGTHWWNIQESGFNYKEVKTSEICNGVLYREGLNWNREFTYTPRLLLVDLNGSLKHLPSDGELYGNCYKRWKTKENDKSNDAVKKLKEDLEWKESEVEMVESPAAVPHEFQKDLDDPTKDIEMKDYNLAESVDTWVDFLYARYHPRSTNIINEYQHDPAKQTFDTYSAGVQLWDTEQFEDEFCDKIRQYSEECDLMQGFQIIFDAFNGHSGLAVKCLEHIKDHYDKATFAVPVYAPKNILYENADGPMSDSIRTVNSALCFSGLAEHASLFVPLSTSERVWRQLGPARAIRNLQFQANNLYQTSAILAAYLDTISIRYRSLSGSYSLSSFCRDLTNHGRKMAAAAFSFPFPMANDMDLIDCLDKFDGPLFTQLTPNCAVGKNYIKQSLSVRGIPQSRLKRTHEQAKAKEQMRMSAYNCQSVSEMFHLYVQCRNHAGSADVTSIEMALQTRTPFPCEIFAENIDVNGFMSPFAKRSIDTKVNCAPTLATVQSSSELADTLETLHREANRIKIAKLNRFRSAGLEEDDYNDTLESLLLFKDNYDDNIHL